MHNYCFLMLLCIAVILLGFTTLVGAEHEVGYDKCSLTVTALNDDNIGAELICRKGPNVVEVLNKSNPIPVGTPKSVPGTPITFFGNTSHVVQISGNADGNTMFELYDSKFVSLPDNLGKMDSILLVQDARLQLTNFELNLNHLSKVHGGIRAVGEGKESPDASEVPKQGPVLEISIAAFTGGEETNGALYIDGFPFVRVVDATFHGGNGTKSKHIHRTGKGTLVVSYCEFLGANDGEGEHESVALDGSGEGTVLVQDSHFTGLSASAINWQSEKGDITNLHFRNCWFENNRGLKGGVAYMRSPLNTTVENCKVHSNIADHLGGGFYISLEDPGDLMLLRFIKSEFYNNKADEGGSAVYLKATTLGEAGYNSELVFEDCKVLSNKESTAILIDGAGFVNATVKDGEFSSNEGCAISFQNVDTIVIEGAKLESNNMHSENFCSGAVHVEDMKSMKVSGCSFLANKAESKKAGLEGGALYVKNLNKNSAAALVLNATTFYQNRADFGGGSLLVDTVASLMIMGTVLNASHTDGSGGGALLKNIKKITAIGVTVVNNVGTTYGGGMAIETCEEVTITGSKFSGNNLLCYGSKCRIIGGGALSIESKNPCLLSINSTNFDGASKYGSGGLLLVSDTSTCVISNSTFNQTAIVDGDGGAAKMGCTEGIEIKGCTFVGGGAANGGGLSFTGPEILVFNTTFKRIAATKKGGGLYSTGFTKAHINGSQFDSNTAGQSGAAVSISGRSIVTIEGCGFTNNRADVAGGAISVLGGKSLNITGGTFTRNSAAFGGAISVDILRDGVKSISLQFLVCTSSTFQENEAHSCGGAIQILGHPVIKLVSSVFVGCKTYGDGACIYLNGSSPLALAMNTNRADLLITDTNFTGASAAKTGGALFVKDVHLAYLVNVVIEDAEGSSGGCASFEVAGHAFMANSKMLNCNAKSGDGGGLRVVKSKRLSINQSVFHNTHAQGPGNGGFLYLNEMHTVHIEESNFTNGTAGAYGGAIYLSGYRGTIKSSNFDRTTAMEGGALAIVRDTHVHMMDTDIMRSKSSSLKGGVLMVSCAAKVKADGQCVVEIPYQTGPGGMDSKEEAETQAIMSVKPNCGSSHIKVDCKRDVWQFGGVKKQVQIAGSKNLWIYMCLVNLGVALIIIIVFLAFSIIKKKPDDEDSYYDSSSSVLEPLYPF